MSSINDGGPAFPGEKNIRFGQPNDCNEGLSLRDYFAAKAMQGFAADPAIESGRTKIAEFAYAWADAMLEARKAKS